jgi:eukaryotic-like serine/threonine-protein kinase
MWPPGSPSSTRYALGPEIGRGGMGVVYEALDTRLKRKVAIKFLGEGGHSADRRRRFLQEARAASSLNHPNIVTVHDVDNEDGVDFIVMEYVDGTPLHRVIEPAGLPLDRMLGYARQISDALAAAHRAGIVHRDLKPSNIMVARDGRLKILDFGLSKLSPRAALSEETTLSSDPKTARGVVVGSPGYMSPEQAVGAAVDARSDVFSLGVVLFELASGARPCAGDDLRALLHEPPRSLLDIRKDIPPAFARLVARCLEKDPADRYPSAIEVERDLDEVFAPQPATGAAAPRTRPRARAAIAAAVSLLLGTAGGAAWIYARRAASERERAAAAEEAQRLVDGARLVDAWRVASAGLRRWPADPRLQSALRASTDTVTIVTDPPGAAVMLKAYTDVDGEWIPLGTSPLDAVRAPLGMLRWRIAKEGFEPLEARLEVGAPAAAAGRPDFEARPIRLRRAGEGPPGAVFVPGARYMGKDLGDYWLDRTEVSNRDFKQFVDRGGYQDPKLWAELERFSPSLFGRLGHIAEFSDRTGRPGPSTWELGAYAEGQGDHPVSGVSWFEAVAYCASVQKTIPTVFHWRKAFGAFFFMEVVTLGNFGGRGPEAVGKLRDLGPYGTYGMAGNVKEWVWNEVAGKRYILGGGWNEPVYMATTYDARPPLDRAETNGFRCMKDGATADASVFAPWGEPRGAPPPREPVTDREFAAIRRFYAYDPLPLEARVERTDEHEHWRRERVSFAAAYGGERVLANILLPRNVPPPYQAVIWFPGAYALGLKSTETDLPFSMYFDFIARSGRALVYPVYSETYERRPATPARPPGTPRSTNEWRDLVVRWAKDFGRTVDYLESREDFDAGRIAYYGYSMGAWDSLPILGVESRIKTAILLSGGLDESPPVPEIDPATFLPRVRMPVLMLGGRFDFAFPPESSQKPLFNLLGTPASDKRLVIFENAGHVPPRIELIREVLDWLDRRLGPVQR